MKKYLKIFIIFGILLIVAGVSIYFYINRYPLRNASGNTKSLTKEEILSYDKFYEGISINNIDLKDSSIDIIIMRDSFHHINKKEETLKECRRILKKEGKILIYEFNKKSLIGKVIFLFETLCFEKISMLNINEMKELTYRYFKTGEIIEISKYEYIYIGIK